MKSGEYKEIGKIGSLRRYQFYLWYGGKKQRKQIACPKSAVRTFFRTWEDSIIKKTSAGKMLFEAVDEYLHGEGQSREVIQREQEIRHLDLFKKCIGNIALTNIVRDDIKKYMNFKRKNPGHKYLMESSVGTINRYLDTICVFFNWCIERYYYHKINPTFKCRLKNPNRDKRVVHLTGEWMKEIVQNCSHSKHLETFVMIALCTGMRPSEILKLSWSDVNLDTQIISIEGKNTKDKDRRQILIPLVLNSYLKDQKQCHRYIVHYKGKAVKSIRKSWNNMIKNVSFPGGPDLTPYCLRHNYATFLRAKGVNLNDIGDQMGHASVKTTEIYTHFIGTISKVQIETLSDALQKKD